MTHNKPHTIEARQKISASNKGRVSPMKGRKMPLSAKLAISKARKGTPLTAIRGDKHYNWKGNRSELQKIIRHLVEYRNWRTAVFVRDGHTCVECGVKNGQGKRIVFNADHYPKHFYKILDEYKITSVSEALFCKELWDINNGRTLCTNCHKKTYIFHSNQYVTSRKTSLQS